MKKWLFYLLFALAPFTAFADDFEVLTVLDRHIQISADINGAVAVDKDLQPTTGIQSPLRKFNARMDFLDDKGQTSYYAIGAIFVDCQARTSLDGTSLWYMNNNATPIVHSPNGQFLPIKTNNTTYPAMKRICNW